MTTLFTSPKSNQHRHVVRHVVKSEVSHHKTIARVILFVGIIAVLVACHESHLTFVALGYKALDMFGDVIADRVFPSDWF